jgi:hypothetical protein
MPRKAKEKYSTKQDNVPNDDALRKKLIEEFIAQNKGDEESFQEFEAVPYEASQIIRSTAGGKGKKSNK